MGLTDINISLIWNDLNLLRNVLDVNPGGNATPLGSVCRPPIVRDTPGEHARLDSRFCPSRRKIFKMDYCEHIAAIAPVKPSADGCEDCLKTGDSWVHLRLCESCGHVGCCDSSPKQHATKHF